VTKIQENLHFLMVFIFTNGSASVLEDKGRILMMMIAFII